MTLTEAPFSGLVASCTEQTCTTTQTISQLAGKHLTRLSGFCARGEQSNAAHLHTRCETPLIKSPERPDDDVYTAFVTCQINTGSPLITNKKVNV